MTHLVLRQIHDDVISSLMHVLDASYVCRFLSARAQLLLCSSASPSSS